MNREAISVFVPAYNEEKIVGSHIKEIYSFLSKHFEKFEIVVVNDSSRDKTQEIIEKLSKQHKEIRCIYFTNGPSRRENLGKAMKSAKYGIVVYMDLDLAVPVSKLPELIQEIKNGNDIAIGSRRTPGANVKRSAYRSIWSKLYHTTIKVMFNSSIMDYQCGFKAFKKDVLFDILKTVGYDKTFRRGWFWDAEVLLTGERKGYKIKEIPVVWREGAKTSFNVKRELKTLPYIISFRFK